MTDTRWDHDRANRDHYGYTRSHRVPYTDADGRPTELDRVLVGARRRHESNPIREVRRVDDPIHTTRRPPPHAMRCDGGGRQDGDGGLRTRATTQRPILLTTRGAGGRRGALGPDRTTMCDMSNECTNRRDGRRARRGGRELRATDAAGSMHVTESAA